MAASVRSMRIQTFLPTVDTMSPQQKLLDELIRCQTLYAVDKLLQL